MRLIMLALGVVATLLAPNVAAEAPVCDGVYPQMSCGLRYNTEQECSSVGCCWDASQSTCFFGKINGYTYSESFKDDSSFGGDLKLKAPSGGFGPDFENLSVQFIQETSKRVHMKIAPTGADGQRWEVPDSVLPRPKGSSRLSSSSMQYHIVEDPFQVVIRRAGSTQDLFFLSKMLVFQDQYIQFVLGTPKNAVATFGFGEATRHSQKMQYGQTHSLWATDQAAAEFDDSLYGAHPFFIQVLDDGTAHGAFFLNSNAMDVALYHDDTGAMGDSIGIQTTGGLVDVYFFSGSSPTDVLRQYQEVVGKPMMPPFWSLGFHNCRWGYENLDYVKDVVANYSAAGIPLETQWVDIDYMDAYKDFTVDPTNFPAQDMQAFIAQLNSNEQHFVPIVDPGIYAISEESDPYPALVEGLEQNVFVKDLTNEKLYLGQVWPGVTYFPDWFAANATSYWTSQLVQFHKLLGYSGLWIDMNEVSNFCNADGMAQSCELDFSGSPCDDGCCGMKCVTVDPTNKYDVAPFVPHVFQGSLGGKTIAASAIHQDGVTREYDAHSLYGLMESIATNKAVIEATGERPFVLSRSTFPGSGVHTAHWTGDNKASWDNLVASITTMNMLSVFGMSMTGADICGFIDDTTEELCARWIEVGAFSPFSRNHNSINMMPQELYRWESVTEASRSALELRYRMLPHLYTLMYQASAQGTPVMNGLWMQFPADADAVAVEEQYMWSDSVLFTPVVRQGATSVTGYFPAAKWYPLGENCAGPDVINGPASVNLDTPLTATNVHIRGGTVLPAQQYAMTTAAVKRTPYTLIVAADPAASASGSLYIDSGVSVVDNDDRNSADHVLLGYTFNFEGTSGSLVSEVQTDTYSMTEAGAADNVPLGWAVFLGVPVTDGSACSASVTVSAAGARMGRQVPAVDVKVKRHSAEETAQVVVSFVTDSEDAVHIMDNYAVKLSCV